MNTMKLGVFLAACALLVIVLVACQPETLAVTRVVEQEVTRVVTETVGEEVQPVEVTRVVTEEVIVEVPGGEEATTEAPLRISLPESAEPMRIMEEITDRAKNLEIGIESELTAPADYFNNLRAQIDAGESPDLAILTIRTSARIGGEWLSSAPGRVPRSILHYLRNFGKPGRRRVLFNTLARFLLQLSWGSTQR